MGSSAAVASTGSAPERTGATGGPAGRTTASRGRPRNPDIDARIRRAVIAELAVVSYEQLRVQTVAERAGIPLSTLYRRHQSKLDLVKDAFSDIATQVVTLDPGLPFAEGLRVLLEFTLDLHRRGPVGAAIVRLFAAATEDSGLESIRRDVRAARARLLVWLQGCQDRGDIPAWVDLGVFLDMAIGVIPYRMLVSGEPIPDNLPELLLPLLLSSVGAAPSGRAAGTAIRAKGRRR
jgi:AcrR family transcriptional regulator